VTGEPEGGSLCPLCGGRLRPGLATIPFVLGETVIVVKGVPAEICGNCHEPFTAGRVTDTITTLLAQLHTVNTEVSVVHYPASASQAA